MISLHHIVWFDSLQMDSGLKDSNKHPGAFQTRPETVTGSLSLHFIRIGNHKATQILEKKKIQSSSPDERNSMHIQGGEKLLAGHLKKKLSQNLLLPENKCLKSSFKYYRPEMIHNPSLTFFSRIMQMVPPNFK